MWWIHLVIHRVSLPNRPETLEVEPEEVDTDEKGPHTKVYPKVPGQCS